MESISESWPQAFWTGQAAFPQRLAAVGGERGGKLPVSASPPLSKWSCCLEGAAFQKRHASIAKVTLSLGGQLSLSASPPESTQSPELGGQLPVSATPPARNLGTKNKRTSLGWPNPSAGSQLFAESSPPSSGRIREEVNEQIKSKSKFAAASGRGGESIYNRQR